MTRQQRQNPLLDSLQKLYSRVTRLVLHTRMHSPSTTGGSAAAPDIANPLSDQIDKLAAGEDAGCQGIACEEANKVVQLSSKENIQEKKVSDGNATVLNTVLNGLTEHFKSNKSGSTVEPYLSEKLQKSTWEHVHTAIRLARQGEVKLAKVHADIASHALKEAAHYMSDEEFTAFADEIEKALKENQSF